MLNDPDVEKYIDEYEKLIQIMSSSLISLEAKNIHWTRFMEKEKPIATTHYGINLVENYVPDIWSEHELKNMMENIHDDYEQALITDREDD